MSSYSVTFKGLVPNSSSTFTRTFSAPSWVDGQDVVQAADTPTEPGFNSRLQQMSADLDAVKADLVNAYALIAQLRADVATALVAVAVAINSKPDKAAKETKETKEGKDGKETKDTKEAKDGKETKEKDTKEGKEAKDTKEHKDGKETKETKDVSDKGASFAEKLNDRTSVVGLAAFAVPFSPAATDGIEASGHAFIQLDERPPVGERLYESPV